MQRDGAFWRPSATQREKCMSNHAPRMDQYAAAPELYGQLAKLSQKLHGGALDRKLLALIDFRVSQINGCAFCIDMHAKEARLHGERELRLYAVAAWRESALFSDRERAALRLAESVTRLGEHGVPDEVYAEARAQFDDAELAQLVLAVAVINAWNRISISFLPVPGSMDKVYGIDKAGVS